MELQKKQLSEAAQIHSEMTAIIREAFKPVEKKASRLTGIAGTLGPVGALHWVEEVVSVPSAMALINRDVTVEQFKKYTSLLSIEDLARHKEIAAKGDLCIATAIKVAENTLSVALDRSINPRDFKEAGAFNTPSLSAIRKYKGDEKVVSVVSALIAKFASRFGERNKLSEADCLELSGDIVIQFPILTIAELKMILNRAVSYEKIFQVDYQTVLRIVALGLDEKLEWSEKTATDNLPSWINDEKMDRWDREWQKSQGAYIGHSDNQDGNIALETFKLANNL